MYLDKSAVSVEHTTPSLYEYRSIYGIDRKIATVDGAGSGYGDHFVYIAVYEISEPIGYSTTHSGDGIGTDCTYMNEYDIEDN